MFVFDFFSSELLDLYASKYYSSENNQRGITSHRQSVTLLAGFSPLLLSTIIHKRTATWCLTWGLERLPSAFQLPPKTLIQCQNTQWEHVCWIWRGCISFIYAFRNIGSVLEFQFWEHYWNNSLIFIHDWTYQSCVLPGHVIRHEYLNHRKVKTERSQAIQLQVQSVSFQSH